VLRLASDYLHDPVEVKVESESIAVDKIEQKLFHLGRQEKLPYLINQIFEAGDIRAIIFTNYRSTVSYLVNSLRRFGIAAVGLSSLLDQRKRVRLLKDFKLGHYTVLVATDVASRGLHVDDVTHVFNYDLPQDAEGYIHRIGRTARAGKSGIAVSYCCEEDYENLPRIQRLMGIKIPQGTIDMKNLNMPEGEFEPFHDRVHAHRDTAATEREHGPEGAREARPPRDNAEGGERQDGVRRRRRRRRGGGGGERGPEGAREARPPREDAPNGNTRDVGSVRDLDRAELMGRLRDREEGRPPKHEHPHSQKAHHEGAGRRRHRGGRGEGEGAPRQGREEHAQGRGNGDRPERGNERGNDRGGERGGRHRGGGGRGDRNDQQHRGGGHGRGGRGQGRGGEGRGERGGRRRRGGNNEQRREHRRPGGQPQKKGFFARIISLFKKSED
ncbi:MAG: DEAD/DEAH box helicase, partial [Spirochaetia bacterium]|nr:DEAD/DEAH box helicase [Spirochaetia bacterium]